MPPPPNGSSPNNRSAVVKLIGPASASFTMWLAGDADTRRSVVELAGYDRNPGMGVNVLKADHHGSCNGAHRAISPPSTAGSSPRSARANTVYAHAGKRIYESAGTPWYRTDQNGTITIRSPGTLNGGYTVTLPAPAPTSTAPATAAPQTDCALWVRTAPD
jgi:beta-lactamase superfamily II metal-dependent hydrolase